MPELRLDEPTQAALAQLEPVAAERLRALIQSAATRQNDALGRAVEDAIAFVPAILRKRVRKMIVG